MLFKLVPFTALFSSNVPKSNNYIPSDFIQGIFPPINSSKLSLKFNAFCNRLPQNVHYRFVIFFASFTDESSYSIKGDFIEII